MLSEWFYFSLFIGGQECVGHSFAYVAHLYFLGDVWIRTQSAAIAMLLLKPTMSEGTKGAGT